MTYPTVSVYRGRVRIERGRDYSVQIPEEFLKAVGFLGEVTHQDAHGTSVELLATGFIVTVPSEKIPNKHYPFFVTAKHAVKALLDRRTYILVNKIGGGVTTLNIQGDGQVCGFWQHPTDKTADVAVLLIGESPDADVGAIMASDFVTSEDFKNKRIGIGDEVFITGLFTAVPGSTRNMPILRHGNIAMLPGEQIQTNLGYADVYLIEARSIGGLSGSPVYARPTVLIACRDEQAKLVPFYGLGTSRLLGLMHGHWDVNESEINNPAVCQDRRGVNYGIAIVVPAHKILETLNHPELVEIRNKWDDEEMRSQIPGTDSAKPKRDDKPQHVFTRTEFESALKKATRKTTAKK